MPDLLWWSFAENKKFVVVYEDLTYQSKTRLEIEIEFQEINMDDIIRSQVKGSGKDDLNQEPYTWKPAHCDTWGHPMKKENDDIADCAGEP